MPYKKGSSEILLSTEDQLLEHALLVPPQFKLLEDAGERDDWPQGSGRLRLGCGDLRVRRWRG